jgi:hypothetical protein
LPLEGHDIVMAELQVMNQVLGVAPVRGLDAVELIRQQAGGAAHIIEERLELVKDGITLGSH